MQKQNQAFEQILYSASLQSITQISMKSYWFKNGTIDNGFANNVESELVCILHIIALTEYESDKMANENDIRINL